MVQVTMPNLPGPMVNPKTGFPTRLWLKFFLDIWRRSGEFGDIGSLTDGDKGDITVSAVGATWTIDSNAITTTKIIDEAVTLAKIQHILTASFLGRNTAGTGDVERLSMSTSRTMLNVEDGAAADMTGAEIKSAYEGESNTNAFTDAEQTKLGGIETSADVTDATNVEAAGAVMEADYDAHTVLAATSDDTPAALTVAEQTLVGRITSGNIDALTITEIHTLLSSIYRLNVNTTEVGNVGAGEDNLITYSLPADTLAVNGQGVRITVWGTTANNGDAKEVKGYFGSEMLSPGALTVSQTSVWRAVIKVFRTGVGTQDYIATFTNFGTAVINLVVEGTLTEDETAGITIKMTGEATSNDDIIQKGMLVEFIN